MLYIFEAGIEQGEDEQSSYEWGTYATTSRKQRFSRAIYDIVNRGLGWDDPHRVEIETINDEWLKDIT